MNSLILVVILSAILYSSVQTLDCNTGNPCDLDSYHEARNGYQCLQVGTDALCTCPGGYETNRPCRLCNRSDVTRNACVSSTKLVLCLETTAYGTFHVCLCTNAAGDEYLTTDANCNPTVTIPIPATTTVAPAVTLSLCANGGVLVGTECHCPSGFHGQYCRDYNPGDLCDGKYRCKNNGVCAVRRPNGHPEPVCLCRYGTWGPYCELNGTLGFCSSGSCLNGGACQENVIGTTRHAYCQCPAGFSGVKCETPYFTCRTAGKFTDSNMGEQSKYFECVTVNGALQAQYRSCPRGLRFNQSSGQCAY